MKYSASNKPVVCMLTQSTCYKGTTIGKPVGILWHETNGGNPYISRYAQPSDNDPNKDKLLALLGKNKYGNDWNHVPRNAGVNYFVGKFTDGSVGTIQALPDNYRPWGCGSGVYGSCNGTPKKDGGPYPFWIQFEICDDGYVDRNYFLKAYQEAVELTAYLCKLYGIDPNGTVTYMDPDKKKPVTVPTILCHHDSNMLGLGSDHDDIYGWFNRFGKNMTTARADVSALLKASEAPVGNNHGDSFNPGDIVKITGKKYYSGATVPAWVLEKKWIVYSVKGDRVVLNRSVDGSATLMSPFKAADLVHTTAEDDSEIVETGDLVKITGKQYYSGASIPQWVLNKKWYVHNAQVGSDRVVINKSEDGKSEIMSPINRKNLAVVKKHK